MPENIFFEKNALEIFVHFINHGLFKLNINVKYTP